MVQSVALEAKLADAEAKLKAASAKLEDGRVDAMQKEIDEMEAHLSDKIAELTDAQDELDEQRDACTSALGEVDVRQAPALALAFASARGHILFCDTNRNGSLPTMFEFGMPVSSQAMHRMGLIETPRRQNLPSFGSSHRDRSRSLHPNLIGRGSVELIGRGSGTLDLCLCE